MTTVGDRAASGAREVTSDRAGSPVIGWLFKTDTGWWLPITKESLMGYPQKLRRDAIEWLKAQVK
jgi:hypothetical protein